MGRMKPEPLKDKQGKKHDPNEMTFYYEIDIQLAVEWLKIELKDIPTNDITILNKVIDKAFEDVIKKELGLE